MMVRRLAETADIRTRLFDTEDELDLYLQGLSKLGVKVTNCSQEIAELREANEQFAAATSQWNTTADAVEAKITAKDQEIKKAIHLLKFCPDKQDKAICTLETALKGPCDVG